MFCRCHLWISIQDPKTLGWSRFPNCPHNTQNVVLAKFFNLLQESPIIIAFLKNSSQVSISVYPGMEHAAQARGWPRIQLERCSVQDTNSNTAAVGRIPLLRERWHHCVHYDSLPGLALTTKLFLGTNRLIWESPTIYIHHEYLVEESHMMSILSQC